MVDETRPSRRRMSGPQYPPKRMPLQRYVNLSPTSTVGPAIVMGTGALPIPTFCIFVLTQDVCSPIVPA